MEVRNNWAQKNPPDYPGVKVAIQKTPKRQQPSKSLKAPLSVQKTFRPQQNNVKPQQKNIKPQQEALQSPTQKQRMEDARKAFLDAFKGRGNR